MFFWVTSINNIIARSIINARCIVREVVSISNSSRLLVKSEFVVSSFVAIPTTFFLKYFCIFIIIWPTLDCETGLCLTSGRFGLLFRKYGIDDIHFEIHFVYFRNYRRC